ANAAHAQVKPGEPPITATTQQSGGPISPERAALHLAHVDLAIEVFPDRQRIAGVAVLTITSAIAQKALQIDLDRNQP
ncbi:M1 family metallopeptidase, partial [Acinetobacter baumannii]|uniref:M1 family metallopeptidase n=1 Tax=Acinetobacter baumannii TaxID=470 RepID=UPI0013D1EAA9